MDKPHDHDRIEDQLFTEELDLQLVQDAYIDGHRDALSELSFRLGQAGLLTDEIVDHMQLVSGEIEFPAES